MANKKIAELDPASPLGTDELPAQRSPTVNVKLTVEGLVGVAQAYSNPAYPGLLTVNDVLDQLLYVPLAVTAFTNSVGTVEVGSTVNAVNLAWSYNKAVLSQGITPTPGSLPLGDRTAALSSLGLVSDTTFTVTGSDSGGSASRSTAVLFWNKRFWGTSATVTPADGTFIDALGSSEFSTSRNQSRLFNGGGLYLYFAWPSAFGPPTFTVNGFPVSGWVKTTVSYLNGSGHTAAYDIYRSEYVQAGTNIAVVVT